jgi:hypothetical protein
MHLQGAAGRGEDALRLPGLIQIIFTTPRHDPQAVADRRFSEAVSFAVVARITIPTSEVAGLTELLNRQAPKSAKLGSRLPSLPYRLIPSTTDIPLVNRDSGFVPIPKDLLAPTCQKCANCQSLYKRRSNIKGWGGAKGQACAQRAARRGGIQNSEPIAAHRCRRVRQRIRKGS